MLARTLFILLLLTSFVCKAQTKALDSMRTAIKNYPGRDTIRANLLMDYVMFAVNENTVQLKPYFDEIISISKEKKYNRGAQFGYMTAQIYYSDRGDFANGILYADSAFLFLKTDTSEHAIVNKGYLHNNLGGDYLKMGDYHQSVFHYTQAAQILEKKKPEALSAIYSGLAEAYELLLMPDKATEYDKRAIEAAEKSGNESSIAKRYLNYIGKLINRADFAEADILLKKITSLVKKLNQAFCWILYYQHCGYVLQHQKKLEAAVISFKKAYNYSLTNDDKYFQIVILSPLSKCLLEADKPEEAKKYLDTLMIQSARYKMPFGQLNAYAGLADWYTANGNYIQANEYLNKKIKLSDSISSDEVKNKIALIETRYKVKGKDNEIKMLQSEKKLQQVSIKQKNTLNYILIGSAIALLTILILSYRNYKHRQKIQQQRITELETEKQLLAIQSLLKGQEDERSRLAKDLHDGLGGLLSGVKLQLGAMKGNLILSEEHGIAFNNALSKLDESISEMRRVAHNMMPETLMKLGLQQALQDYCEGMGKQQPFTINCEIYGLETRLDGPVEITVYRIVQELLNNAVKHSGATTILTQVIRQENNLTITVEDNGKGFNLQQAGVLNTAGLKNIQSRVNYLNGKMDIQSEPGKSTSIYIDCKIE